MSVTFEVEINKLEKQEQHTDVCDQEQPTDVCKQEQESPYRYKARWFGGQYLADNIVCNVSAVFPNDNEYYANAWTEYSPRTYEDSFVCRSRTLEACINEAEYVLKDCLFGKAELLDGKYRVATVTKRADDRSTNSNLTHYGEKCKKSEPKD